MQNGFPEKVYDMWNTLSPDSGKWYECFRCGRNHTDCLHHNFGRGPKANKGFRSFLNSVPLNNNLCHLPGHGANKRNLLWLKRTFEFFGQLVQRYGYIPNANDKSFYETHRTIYKKLNLYENFKTIKLKQ